jgi:hypothetical protein
MIRQLSVPSLRKFLGRFFLILAYVAFSIIVSFILGGPDGRGAWEPMFILASWAIIALKQSPILWHLGPSSFFIIFFLYLIWISLLTTLLSSFNRPHLKFIILIFHGLGSFLALSMLEAEERIPGWPPFFSITGLVIFWIYLSLDWRLATGKKKQPNG